MMLSFSDLLSDLSAVDVLKRQDYGICVFVFRDVGKKGDPREVVAYNEASLREKILSDRVGSGSY